LIHKLVSNSRESYQICGHSNQGIINNQIVEKLLLRRKYVQSPRFVRN
jgi:uncharacterized membrane protein YjdF